MKLSRGNPVFNPIALKDFRLKMGWSAYKLETESGVTESMICRLEKGKIPYPSYDTVRRLSFALRISSDDLANPMNI